ncbi:MAG: hypothetical protein U0169_12165 [Polyangiaceae bacterium]
MALAPRSERPAPAVRASRTAALVRLGFREATRGFVTWTTLGIGVILTTVLALVFAPAVGRVPSPPIAELGAMASGTLAWGVCVTLAFAWSLAALANDRKNGVVDLLRSRGHGLDAYLGVRVSGLALLLVAVVTSGTFVVLGVASIVAGTAPAFADAARTFLATTVYAVAFALVLATTTLACFAARSRVVGYLILVVVLSLPDALGSFLEKYFSKAWVEVLSVTRATAALREALSPPGIDGPRAARAGVVIALFVVAALVALRAQVKRSAREVFS